MTVRSSDIQCNLDSSECRLFEVPFRLNRCACSHGRLYAGYRLRLKCLSLCAQVSFRHHGTAFQPFSLCILLYYYVI